MIVLFGAFTIQEVMSSVEELTTVLRDIVSTTRKHFDSDLRSRITEASAHLVTRAAADGVTAIRRAAILHHQRLQDLTEKIDAGCD